MDKKDVTIIKVCYVWQESLFNFNTRYRIIKSINKNFKVPLMNVNVKNEEIILKPRYITNDPFGNENNLLAICDIFSTEGDCINFDKRNDLNTFLKDNEQKIKNDNPKFTFHHIIDYRTEISDKYITLNKLINLCLSCKIDIQEYFIENNKFHIINNFTDPLNVCDEILLFLFIVNKYFEIEGIKYTISENFSYKYLDSTTNQENGIEKLNQIKSKIKNITIPKTIEKLKQGYYIDESHNFDKCPYSIYTNILNNLYK